MLKKQCRALDAPVSCLHKPRAVTLQPEEVKQAQDRSYVYDISEVDITAVDRLGLIITRLDPDETTDPEGNYHITLNSTEASDLP